jgi:penicillin amidase
MIVTAPGPIDIAYIQKMQGDNKNANAEILIPILMGVVLDDVKLEGRRELLLNWEGKNDRDSAPAALFSVFWKHLLEDTLYDELPMSSWPNGDSRSIAMIHRLVEQPGSPWWDKKDTAVVETRDEIFRQSFGEAVDELESRLGTDASSWRWGDLHTVTFNNQTLGQSGIKPIEALFNRGPFAVGGGSSIVNATSWDASSSEDTYVARYVPSMRMIVDLSNLQNSLAIHTTGQSGHPYHPHYIDMAEMWADIQYHPMHWERAQVEASAAERLQLFPVEAQP